MIYFFIIHWFSFLIVNKKIIQQNRNANIFGFMYKAAVLGNSIVIFEDRLYPWDIQTCSDECRDPTSFSFPKTTLLNGKIGWHRWFNPSFSSKQIVLKFTNKSWWEPSEYKISASTYLQIALPGLGSSYCDTSLATLILICIALSLASKCHPTGYLFLWLLVMGI